MDSGRLIIDSRDMGSYYGATLTHQGVNALLSWPSSKAVDTDDWAESDYVSADLSDLRLSSKEVNVNFGMSGHHTDIRNIADWLSSEIYRSWNLASLGRSYTLRYTGTSGLGVWPWLQSFSIGVAQDDPVGDYEYSAPVSHIPSLPDYTLDGVRLSDYGIRVLFGTLDTVASPGSVKERLKRDASVIDGVIYDSGASNVLKAKEITLKCALIDPTLAGVWRNYDALLHDLIRKDDTAAFDTDKCKRSLYSNRTGMTFDCYYKSQSVTDFSPSGGRVWILFDLKLGVIGDGERIRLLAAESGSLVETENGNKIII